MKTNTKQILFAILVFVLAFTIKATMAQSLIIKGKVSYEKKNTLEKATVVIYDLKTSKITDSLNVVRSFSYNIPFNKQYLLIVYRDGYQPKSIYIDSECNSNKSVKYLFSVDLKPKEIQDNIPVAVGGIYYNKKKDEFTYYLTN